MRTKNTYCCASRYCTVLHCTVWYTYCTVPGFEAESSSTQSVGFRNNHAFSSEDAEDRWEGFTLRNSAATTTTMATDSAAARSCWSWSCSPDIASLRALLLHG